MGMVANNARRAANMFRRIPTIKAVGPSRDSQATGKMKSAPGDSIDNSDIKIEFPEAKSGGGPVGD
jgi:hypothetical protein